MNWLWRQGLLLALALAAVVSVAGEEPEEPPPPVGVTTRDGPAAVVVEATLPGTVEAWTVLRRSGGPSSLALLVATGEGEDSPRSLFRLDLADGGSLHEIHQGMAPEAATIVAFDLDGDGREEPLIGEPGRFFSAVAGESLQTVLETGRADLVYPPSPDLGGATSSVDELVLAGVGVLQAYSLDTARGVFSLLWEQKLPVSVERGRYGLELRAPEVVRLQQQGQQAVYAVGPEPNGQRRLRTLLIGGEDAQPSDPTEAWSQLPAAESVEEAGYALLNGEPVLVATTVPADKRGIFVKKRLRVFPLTPDRTRLGTAPVLEAMTRTRNWYPTGTGIADLDGDDRADLVLIQPKGLGGGKLVVEGFLTADGGGFEAETRLSILEVETEIWSFGRDVSGDGVADLVVLEGRQPLVYRGVRGPDVEGVVEAEPWWRGLESERVRGELRVEDLVGDSRAEIAMILETKGGRGRIAVARLK